jgi:hypothetical protein
MKQKNKKCVLHEAVEAVCAVCVYRWVFRCKVLHVGVFWVNMCCVFMVNVYVNSGGIKYIYKCT